MCILGWNVTTVGPICPWSGSWLGLRPFRAEFEKTLHRRRVQMSFTAIAGCTGLTLVFACHVISSLKSKGQYAVMLISVLIGVVYWIFLVSAVIYVAWTTDPIRSRVAAYFVFMASTVFFAIVGLYQSSFLPLVPSVAHWFANMCLFGVAQAAYFHQISFQVSILQILELAARIFGQFLMQDMRYFAYVDALLYFGVSSAVSIVTGLAIGLTGWGGTPPEESTSTPCKAVAATADAPGIAISHRGGKL